MLDISRIKAISLDLDDTLWPIWPTIARAETRLQEWLRPHAPATAQLFSSGEQRQDLRAQVDARWPERHHDLSFMRHEMIRLGLERNGEDQALADAAFEVFFAARQEVPLFDDAHASLAALSARWPVLALSNGNADVQRIGLGHYFCASVSARDAGAAKPDLRIFALAAQRLQLAPEDILHVGDDAHMDVLGALQAGMQTAWINRSSQVWSLEAQPHASVASMAELCRVLLV
ncbi:MAG: HAD-IA family hydrolase [Rhodoferax sp.]|nr:HAD-IA family hydrolase [Rhodoferax sp.]